MRQAFTVMRKILARNRVVRVYRTVYLLVLLGYGLFLQLKGRTEDYIADAESMMYMAVVGYGFFLYMGYTIGRMSHMLSSRLQPGNSSVPLSEIPGGMLGCAAAAFWHLLVSALGSLVIAVLMMQTMGNMADPSYLTLDRMIASGNSACLLYYFLAPLTGGLMGMALSRLLGSRTRLAYCIIGALILLPHGVVDSLIRLFTLEIPEGWGLDGYYWIKDWFVFSPYRISQLWSQANQPGMDPVYGIPQEAARWFQMLFWMLLSLAVILPVFARTRKTKRIFSALCGVLSLVMAVAFAGKGALRTEDDRPIETVWETRKVDSELANHAPGAEAGFVVESCDMELTMGQKLSVHVKMTVSALEKARDQYFFTLHENMHIASLTDGEGRIIPYTRQDHLLCFDRAQLPEGGIVQMTYSGSLSGVFANDQAAALPAWYPYYPKAGACYSDMTRGNEPKLAKEPIVFTVRVNAPYAVACNLPGEANCFSGEARGLSLMGSAVMNSEDAINGLNFYKGESIDSSRIRIFARNVVSDVTAANVRLGCEMDDPWLREPGEIHDSVFVMPDSWLSSLEDTQKVVFCQDHIWVSRDFLNDSDGFAVEYIRSFLHEDHKNCWMATAFINYILNLDERSAIEINPDPEYLMRQAEKYFTGNEYYGKEASILMMYLSMDYVSEYGGNSALMQLAGYLSQPRDSRQYVNEFAFLAELMKSVTK